MAYTPINWQTGDTITADRLNRMDRGWRFEETELFSETVTTAEQGGMYGAALAYSETIDADTLTVTFDGTEYVCSRIDKFGNHFYGGFGEQGPVFTECPFCLVSNRNGNTVYTETASTHTVAASVASLQTSADFDAARGYGYVTSSPTELFSETVTTAVGSQGDPIAQLAYSGIMTADTITVTFDGTEYTCPRIDRGDNYYYGGFDNGPDFTTYPFFIWSSGITNQLITQTVGEHTIAVTASVTSMQTSADFGDAVNSCVQLPSILVVDTIDNVTDKTWNKINDEFVGGVICTILGFGPVLQMWFNESDNRYYMATGFTSSGNGAFDPMIWRTSGTSADTGVSLYRHNSQMP